MISILRRGRSALQKLSNLLGLSIVWRRVSFRLVQFGRIRSLKKIISRDFGRTDEPADQRPVLFVNASVHKEGPSFFTFVSVVVMASLKLVGRQIRILQCAGGLSRCNIPVGNPSFGGPPPCQACKGTSHRYYPTDQIDWYGPEHRQPELRAKLNGFTSDELTKFEYRNVKIGILALASLRWAIRRFNLPEDESVRSLFAEYVASSVEFFDFFEAYLERLEPSVVVAFNGVFVPEAVAKIVAESKGIRFVSFEVGFRKMNSIFFAEGVAAEMPITIPEDYELNSEQLAWVRSYIAGRFSGSVYLGARQFWDRMDDIHASLKTKIDAHRQTVTVFTNVVFDTSQVSVSTIFSDMFDWLRATLEIARQTPDTLFILRVHPEEARASRPAKETAQGWLESNTDFLDLENIVLIPPHDSVNSYLLIDESAFCLVYNSTVGVEATLRKKPVLSGASSKYAMAGFTHLPDNRAEYLSSLKAFLQADSVPFDESWIQRAEYYLYFLVNRYSLDVSKLVALQDLGKKKTDYGFMSTQPGDLLPAASEEIKVIHEGLFQNRGFHYPL